MNLIRYRSRWQIDTGFNADHEPYVGPPIQQITEQPDGKVLYLAAVPDGSDTSGYSAPWQIRRLNADGSRDTSFDVGSGPNGRPEHLRVLRGGDILVWGEFTRFDGKRRMRIVRLRAE